MSRQRKTNQKKSSTSENYHWQENETSQPSSSGSSLKRPGYPNVPKRTRQSLFADELGPIETESRIDIIPSGSQSQGAEGSLYNRNMLDYMTKYTSPQKSSQKFHQHSSSPVQNEVNNQLKTKRTLSPLEESDRLESKRTKSFDDDDEDDDNEISQLIDHRRHRPTLSQNSNTSILSQVTNDGEPRRPTVRKPTARKFSTNQRKPSASQPIPIERQEIILIEPDNDSQDRNTINHEGTSWLTEPIEHEVIHHSTPTPTIPSPIKLILNNPNDFPNTEPTASFTPIHSSKPTLDNPIDASSPCLTTTEAGRRFSTTSSNSLLFDTPNSSFSRTATNSTITSTPPDMRKTDRETQISIPSNIDLINQLISQMNITSNTIDYDPSELARRLFHQSSSFSPNKKYPTMNSLIIKQFFHFGRYEIEILFPSDDNKNSIIYACDICLKQFSSSAIAFQRHISKCLCTQPPGKLVFHTDDLAIFQIGETHMNLSQRLYIKSLSRFVRLFLDPNKTLDDTNIDRFVYYILCRRDPMVSQTQLPIYRLIGYFSKELHQQSMHNLSCLFILPPFAIHQEYYQLLIDFSYDLLRANAWNCISPARPIDLSTLWAFRIYWRDRLFAYIIHHHHSSIKSLALDIFARQTLIHPRDILSSLYSYGLLLPNPLDKSTVYLKSYSILSDSNRFLSTMNHDKNRISMNEQNSNKSADSGIEEIILD